ncbi:MAG: hypothetical protein Q8N79_10350 [Candidatus Methanoperedens sp.]|nr:hypothetical protein [Candidatus Methanoperedens sp.]
MEKKLGIYSVLASLATSVVIMLLFYILAMQKVSANPAEYKSVDVYAGMVYVFILSMIVSASIWPGIIEKRLKQIRF